MKYYLFLTSLIRNIGGGHIYTSNKISWLEEQGYNVNLFHADYRHGDIVISDLAKFEKNCSYHLQYPAHIFGEKIRKKIVHEIYRRVPQNCSEIIIESQTINCSTWGELLAKELSAKHLIFLLSEHHRIRSAGMSEFFKFKLRRRELVGIQKKSLPILFQGWWEVPENEQYYLLAHCYNSLKEITFTDRDKIPVMDFVIGSIGRIDKLYMINILLDIKEFVSGHLDKTFTLLIIGGSTSKRDTKRIMGIFKKVENVKVFITGLIYPIPVELVTIPDVFVSTSGSCRVSHSLGKTTIPIDNSDFKPIGVLGVTTNNTLFRDKEDKIELGSLLEDILMRNKYLVNSDVTKLEFNTNYGYSEHMDFLSSSDLGIEYFDSGSINLSIEDWFDKISLLVLGSVFYPKMIKIISPIWIKTKKSFAFHNGL